MCCSFSYQNSAPVQQPTDQWKIVGDNLDLTVRVREMRLDNRDKSLHFFHYFAVKDRISSSHLSRYQPQCLATSLPPSAFYPSADDYTRLCDNFVVHLARIAVGKFAAFKFLKECVPIHLLHRYSNEVSKPSHIVSPIVGNNHSCDVYMHACTDIQPLFTLY